MPSPHGSAEQVALDLAELTWKHPHDKVIPKLILSHSGCTDPAHPSGAPLKLHLWAPATEIAQREQLRWHGLLFVLVGTQGKNGRRYCSNIQGWHGNASRPIKQLRAAPNLELLNPYVDPRSENTYKNLCLSPEEKSQLTRNPTAKSLPIIALRVPHTESHRWSTTADSPKLWWGDRDCMEQQLNATSELTPKTTQQLLSHNTLSLPACENIVQAKQTKKTSARASR